MTDYLNRKALSTLFAEDLGPNTLLVLTKSALVSLVMDKNVVASFKLSNLLPGLDATQLGKVQSMSLDSVILRKKSDKKGSTSESIQQESVTIREISFPVIKGEFFWTIFEISKHVFDRPTFWTIISDLFENHVFRPDFPQISKRENSKIKSQFAHFSECPKELIMGYFCFLLTFENFKSEIFR